MYNSYKSSFASHSNLFVLFFESKLEMEKAFKFKTLQSAFVNVDVSLSGFN